jgi:cyclophilin family peptidyl-prolyl cis-trans isomerase
VTGMDVVHAIEHTSSDKNDKPNKDIQIVNVTIK